MEDASFKACPFCKEKIRKEAVKCRFCGEWLEGSDQHISTATPTEATAPKLPKAAGAPPLPKSSKRTGWNSLTLPQQIVVLVGVALFLCNLIFGTVALLSPLGMGCVVVLIGLFYRFRIPPESGSEDDGYELLERALRLERKGRIEDALKAYEEIAKQYAHNSAGLDAKKSAESLRMQREQVSEKT